jgi:hypothetical protein
MQSSTMSFAVNVHRNSFAYVAGKGGQGFNRRRALFKYRAFFWHINAATACFVLPGARRCPQSRARFGGVSENPKSGGNSGIRCCKNSSVVRESQWSHKCHSY